MHTSDVIRSIKVYTTVSLNIRSKARTRKVLQPSLDDHSFLYPKPRKYLLTLYQNIALYGPRHEIFRNYLHPGSCRLWIRVTIGFFRLCNSKGVPSNLGHLINPSNAEATFVQSRMMQRFFKTTLTLSCWYSLDSSR